MLTIQTVTFEAENDIIRAALVAAGGKPTDAARLLGMPHQTLTQRLNTRNKGAASARTEVVKRHKPFRRRSCRYK